MFFTVVTSSKSSIKSEQFKFSSNAICDDGFRNFFCCSQCLKCFCYRFCLFIQFSTCICNSFPNRLKYSIRIRSKNLVTKVSSETHFFSLWISTMLVFNPFKLSLFSTEWIIFFVYTILERSILQGQTFIELLF